MNHQARDSMCYPSTIRIKKINYDYFDLQFSSSERDAALKQTRNYIDRSSYIKMKKEDSPFGCLMPYHHTCPQDSSRGRLVDRRKRMFRLPRICREGESPGCSIGRYRAMRARICGWPNRCTGDIVAGICRQI